MTNGSWINVAALKVAVIAAEGFSDYCVVHKVDAHALDIARICDALKKHTMRDYEQALHDAKEDASLGMHEVGQMAFVATIRFAGIRAAQEVLGHA